MRQHSIGDRVKLLRVDYPFNNSVGTVVNRRLVAGRSSRLMWEYRIDFDGKAKDTSYHKEICVVPTKVQSVVPAARRMFLSEDPKERKGTPITSGVLDYFPLAIAEVAKCSKAGNDQHNPGQPLHWAKEKSTDHADCIARHLIDRGSIDTDGIRHSAKLAWRALANLQIELENAKKAKQ